MGAKVVIVQRVHHVDAALWKARTDQHHALVVVGSQFSAMLPIPIFRDVLWGKQMVDFLGLLAPPAGFVLSRINRGATQQLLHLIPRLLSHAVKESKELTSHRLCVDW